TASVTMGSCAPLVTTSYKVEKCMVNSSVVYNICSSQNITPAFSAVTIPQTVVPGTVSVTVAPTLGTVTVNPATGQLTYTATTPGVTATDTFTYTFCGSDPEFPECETVTVTINIAQIPVNNVTLNTCTGPNRSEEHTSELQSRENLVCRLLLEKKKGN